MPDNANKVPQNGVKPQTRISFEEWCLSKEYDNPERLEWRREAWNAALKNVIPPEGKRFEVGDRAIDDVDAPGEIVFRPMAVHCLLKKDPNKVRPFPQTVELTVQEKKLELFGKVFSGSQHTTESAWHYIADELMNGKTLDQLCAEYGVPLTKEVS